MAVNFLFKPMFKRVWSSGQLNSAFTDLQLGHASKSTRLLHSIPYIHRQANLSNHGQVYQHTSNLHTTSRTNSDRIDLHLDIFGGEPKDSSHQPHSLMPIIIAHGMLGSASNWSSMAKSLHRKTGRTVITYDARNHGKSAHVETMSYKEMSEDLVSLILNQTNKLHNDQNAIAESQPVILMGHSMGGRTCMYTALSHHPLVGALVVVDVSPINKSFNLEDGSDWNMDHFFHAMKAVKFIQPTQLEGWTMYKARIDADKQLAHRIKDANIRAWLLMNMGQSDTGEVKWMNNLHAIHNSFRKDIAIFPGEHFSNETRFEKTTLFIGGGESEYIPVNHHSEILELFPSAKFDYIDGAGHWVHSQKPKEFLDTVIDFLGQLD